MNRTNLIFVALGLVLFFAWRQYRKPNFIVGESAPDFTATLVDGRTIHFSELKGRYVLLQFWGSWCGPCRRENPHLAELYRKYHERGFDIFSVGIERNPQAWRRAIETDGLIWPYHTADFQEFGGPIAKQFNIKSIPTTFLIKPDGMIEGVNLSPEAIERRLAEVLTK